MTPRLDDGVREYFATPGTVGAWWTPDEGPLRFHYDAELTVLERHLPWTPGSRVLDLGTGRGRFGAWFAARGGRVVGIDLNPDMVAIARSRAQAAGLAESFEVREGSAEDLSAFGAGSFDVVTCMELFDHLPALGPLLTAARRVLTPSGRFVCTYVPGESLYGAIGNVYRWWRRRAGDRIISRTYRARDIATALNAHGFTVEGVWGLGLFCLTAQTRLFQGSPVFRALTAVARGEAAVAPYYARPWLARRASHVVVMARPALERPV